MSHCATEHAPWQSNAGCLSNCSVDGVDRSRKEHLYPQASMCSGLRLSLPLQSRPVAHSGLRVQVSDARKKHLSPKAYVPELLVRGYSVSWNTPKTRMIQRSKRLPFSQKWLKIPRQALTLRVWY